MPETVTLRDSGGRAYGVPQEQVAAYIAQGFRPETDEEHVGRVAGETFHEEHGGVGGALAAGGAGALSGLTLGLSDQLLADRSLRHLREEHPYATGAGTLAGALAPAVLTGGAAAAGEAGLGARILAASPAGLTGRLGSAITGLGEGAGLAGRVVAGTAGAGAEGALYGGGQYLTETALEDKPLSAEGFVAGMGHGALFAAPIGGAGTLASGVLQRARSLFPRNEVSAAAAAGVKEQAAGSLAQTVRDGDAMVAAAERKLSDVDAQTQMAQVGETATRRVFGEAHPQAMVDQVTGAVDKTQIAQALEGYQQARAQLDEWIATEADPELERALAGLRPAGVQAPGYGVPTGEFGAPGARGIKTPEDLQRIAESSGGEGAALPLGQPATRQLRAKGTPVEGVPAQEIVQRGMTGEATTAHKFEDLGLTFDPETKSYFTPAEPAAKAQPSPARELGSEKEFRDLQAAMRLRLDDNEIEQAIRYSREYYDDVNKHLRGTGPKTLPESEAKIIPALDSMLEKSRIDEPVITHRGASLKRVGNLQPGDVYVDPGYGSTSWRSNNVKTFGDAHMIIESPAGTRIAPIPSSKAEGEFLLPRDTKYRITGRRELPDGRVELHATVEDPASAATGNRLKIGPPRIDKPLTAMSKRELEYSLDRAADAQTSFQSAAERRSPEFKAAQERYDEISERLRAVKAGAKIESLSAAPADDLLAALQGTQARLGEGEPLTAMGEPARVEYRTAKAEKTKAAAEHFRAKATERNFAGSEMGAAEQAAQGDAQDRFFAELRRPKTRDAYVAANIGRAMREEGSHAAALAKVEREWSELAATEAWTERAAILEYDGGYSRAEAERIAREETGKAPHGNGAESARPNPRLSAAGKKAAAASVERLHEIHSAVASNLPQELQSAWNEEGYKFLREEASRIRGVKDRISAASKISEAFTEKYGSASETFRGYEGDRFYRRAEIESKHAESWANEQERKYYAAMERSAAAAEPAERAAAAQEADAIKRELTAVGRAPAMESRAGQATAPKAGGIEDLRALVAGMAPTSAAEYEARRASLGMPSALEQAPRKTPEERAIAKAIMRHNGKNVDIGPNIARGAKAIGDMEEASARLTDVLGTEAPATAVENAKAYRAAIRAQSDASAASSAKAGADIQSRVQPAADATVVDDEVAQALRRHEARQPAAAPDATAVDSDITKALRAHDMRTPPAAAASAGGGLGRGLADVGSALEVLHAIGAHVPAVSHIPVIGPVLGLWLKARAVWGILGRKGGSIGRSTEGSIAAKAAATRERIVAATGAILEGAAKVTGKASHLAGPAVLLAGALFPGGDKPESDKPRDLFDARVSEIVRAQQPGAIDQAISQRFPTSDPALHDAIVAQLQRGLTFLDSKRPKQTVMPGVLPGDGTWQPSTAAISEFGKYVHAVNDPVSVLEDLAKGHPSVEGAETLQVVYPALFLYAQKQLLAAAQEMATTLPYSRRAMISILYKIPVDGTMQPSHAQYLQVSTPAPTTSPPPSPTGPLRLGQQTMSPLDQRASGA